jgi:GntR family transcriptional repressor for pyruvate dehydrogenase complex
VVEDVVENFKQALIRRELRAGQRLPSEAELAQQFEVGRGTIREAMKMLQALGVVHIQQGDGTYLVDKPSPALLSPLVFAIMLEASMGKELFELRSLIQMGYCQLAAQNATPEDLSNIEKAAEACESYARQAERDFDRLTRLDLDFHFSILDATHNLLVIRIGHTVEELFFASIRTALSAEDLEFFIAKHRSVLRAIRDGDPGAIHQAVVGSLAHWAQVVEIEGV